MSGDIELTADDGHVLDAYEASPMSPPLGSVVIIQEIFGLTRHVRRIVEQFAAEGYRAIAPAMFDRLSHGIVLDYGDIETGRNHMQMLRWPDTLADVQAAITHLADLRPLIIVGYCWGGTVAHVVAADLDVDIAVSYYGGAIPRFLDKKPKCPIVYHFGELDRSIPMGAVQEIKTAIPNAVYYVYEDAGHGFNCDDRETFDLAASRLAFQRTMEFIKDHSA